MRADAKWPVELWHCLCKGPGVGAHLRCCCICFVDGSTGSGGAEQGTDLCSLHPCCPHSAHSH